VLFTAHRTEISAQEVASAFLRKKRDAGSWSEIV
jgi:hypothetical protein